MQLLFYFYDEKFGTTPLLLRREPHSCRADPSFQQNHHAHAIIFIALPSLPPLRKTSRDNSSLMLRLFVVVV